MIPLSMISDEVREKIEKEVVDILNKRIDEVFPKRGLDVDRDGNVYRIHGNLSLGKLY